MMNELDKHPGDQAVVVAEFEAAADSFGEFNTEANKVMTRAGWRQAIGHLHVPRSFRRKSIQA